MLAEHLTSITAIDPPGCGCLDCITGKSAPIDSPHIDEIFEAVVEGELDRPQNRTTDGTLILYRSHGRVFHDTSPAMVDGSKCRVVFPSKEDNTHFLPEEDAIDVSLLEAQPEDEQGRAITRLLDEDAEAKNPTRSTYILFRSPYGETGIVELYNCEDEPVILPYRD